MENNEKENIDPNNEAPITNEDNLKDESETLEAQVFVDENKKIDATDEDNSFKATYNKAQAAIGLSYHEGDVAPYVSSKGENEKAQAIIDMAKELGIYVHKDPVLFNQLKALEEGEEVPKELFEIIATILAFSYYLQGKTPSSYTRDDGSRAINTEA